MRKSKVLIMLIIMSLFVISFGNAGFASELNKDGEIGGGKSFSSPSLLELIKLSHYTYGNFSREHWGENVDEAIFTDEKLTKELEELKKLTGYEKSQTAMDGWTIQGHAHSQGYIPSGIDGTVFQKGNTFVIAYRGSEQKADFVTDAGLFLNLTETQLPSAKELAGAVFRYIEDNEKAEVYITGHSLGGYLAQKITYMIETGELEIKNKEAFKGAVTFNAPGVWKKDYSASDWGNIQKGNYDNLITNYIITVDIVSGMTFDDHIGKTIILPYLKAQNKHENIFDFLDVGARHSILSFYAYNFNDNHEIIYNTQDQVSNSSLEGTYLSSDGREWFDAGYDGASLFGFSGNDVYFFNKDYGMNQIIEKSGNDVLRMDGISMNELVFLRESGSLNLNIGILEPGMDKTNFTDFTSLQDIIIIKDYFSEDGSHKVENIYIDDYQIDMANHLINQKKIQMLEDFNTILDDELNMDEILWGEELEKSFTQPPLPEDIEKVIEAIGTQLRGIDYYIHGDKMPGFLGVANYYNKGRQNYMRSVVNEYMEVWFENLYERNRIFNQNISKLNTYRKSAALTDEQRKYLNDYFYKVIPKRSTLRNQLFTQFQTYEKVFFDQSTGALIGRVKKANDLEALWYSVLEQSATIKRGIPANYMSNPDKKQEFMTLTQDYLHQTLYNGKTLDKLQTAFLKRYSEMLVSFVMDSPKNAEESFYVSQNYIESAIAYELLYEIKNGWANTVLDGLNTFDTNEVYKGFEDLITSNTKLELPTVSFSGQEFVKYGTRETADPKKTWTVEFSQGLTSESVNDQNIYVLAEDGTRLDTKVSLTNDTKVMVEAPDEGYSPGKKYYLYIDNAVASKKNKALKEPIYLEFTIKN